MSANNQLSVVNDQGFDFRDLSRRQTEPFYIGDRRHVLREPDGEAAARYDRVRVASFEMVWDDDDNRTAKTVADAAELDSLLVSVCLWAESATKPDTFDVPVSQHTVKSWPARVQRALHARAKEVASLDEAEDTVEDLEKAKARIEKRIAKLRDAAKN